jgi:outer membrane protein assembly factor BamD
MKLRTIPLLIILSIFIIAGCSKGQYKLTGNETDEQAVDKCVELSQKKKFDQAIECFEIFKSRFPDSDYALDAELKIADSYFQNKEWQLAAESYALYAKLHPSSPKADYAYYRAGLAYQKQLPKKVDRDMTSLEKSEDNFAMVYRRFPDSPYAKMAQTEYDAVHSRGAAKNVYVGNFYYKFGEYRAAIPRYLIVLQDYPGLGYDEEALYRLAFSYKKLGMMDKAKAAAQLMQEKFPESKKTKKVVGKILGGNRG